MTAEELCLYCFDRTNKKIPLSDTFKKVFKAALEREDFEWSMSMLLETVESAGYLKGVKETLPG